GLVRAMQHDHVVVGPMTDADLRQVIIGPAEASGLTVEPDLVGAILADLRAAGDGGGGILPLLSQAMMLTWEGRDGGQLTRQGYQDAGNRAGIARAIEVTAETAYRGLTEDQQAIAREAFRRMTALGLDRRPVRRAATSRELHSGRPKSEWPEIDAVLEAFARGRLLVLDTDRAEIAHDVLLQAWPRLRGWLEEDETSMVLYGQLAGAAWRLAPTAQARYSLLQSLAQPVRGVLTASSGVVTALAYSPDGTTLAAGYSGGAIRLWDLASDRPISATSWGATPSALAFTGGGKELEVADAAAAGTWNLTDRARITTRPFASPARANAVAFSPDGKTVATGGTDGNVRLWDAATQQAIGSPMSSDAQPVAAVAFSPDGTLVAAGSADGNVQLWDTATEQEAGTALVAGAAEVDALAFSQDGKLLATGGQDGAVRLWDVATGSQFGTTMATGDAVGALTFGTGGTTLASAESDGATELWNVTTQTQTGAALTVQGSAGVSALAFSPAADALVPAAARWPPPAPTARPGSGTWPSRPTSCRPRAASRTYPLPGSNGLTTLGPSHSSRSAPRGSPVAHTRTSPSE
ncbi:MAG TPA: WD40 repeat domain-containing protein, partial [Streptosporangiaceae bacterium]|nr:WD40 repeat domain-containing protein [Streptosporangiaceae bacterium]